MRDIFEGTGHTTGPSASLRIQSLSTSVEISKTNRRIFMRAALATAASYSRIPGANDRIRLGAIVTSERCQYLLSLVSS
jgi:hypothetical protein